MKILIRLLLLGRFGRQLVFKNSIAFTVTIRNTLLCSQIKCWVIRTGNYKMPGRIANSEDADQSASEEAV